MQVYTLRKVSTRLQGQLFKLGGGHSRHIVVTGARVGASKQTCCFGSTESTRQTSYIQDYPLWSSGSNTRSRRNVWHGLPLFDNYYFLQPRKRGQMTGRLFDTSHSELIFSFLHSLNWTYLTREKKWCPLDWVVSPLIAHVVGPHIFLSKFAQKKIINVLTLIWAGVTL